MIRKLIEREYREFSLARWEAWLDSLAAGGPTATGIDVTTEKAMTSAIVWACLLCKSQDMSKIPLPIYRRIGPNGQDGREQAYDHALNRIFRVQANRWMTPVVFRKTMQLSLDIHGAAYAYIERTGSRVTALYPRPGNRITPKFNGPNPYYEYIDSEGKKIPYQPEELFRLIGMTHDGITPISPVENFRETIGLDLAYQDHGAYLFKNRATPSIVLETASSLTSEKAAQLLKDFMAGWSGLANSGKAAVAHSGLSIKPFGFSNKDSEYLDSRHFSIEQGCRIWRMPPHKVMDYLRATFSNVTQIDLSYLNDTLKPDQCLWEEAISAQLMTEQEQSVYYAEFDNFDLLKGTPIERAQVETLYVNSGISTRNEVRRSHNWNPIAGGDDATAQSQNVPLEKLGQEVVSGQNGNQNAGA